MLMTWPDVDEKVAIVDIPSYTRKARSQKRARTSTRPEDISTISEFLDTLPTEIVNVAEQPIVRGAIFRKGGITGNISYVVLARRMIYGVLQGSSIPDDWATHIDVARSIAKVQMGPGAKKNPPILPFLCPECNSVI